MADEIPEGWKECRLGDYAKINMGQSPKSEYYNNSDNGIPFLQGNRTFGRRFPTIDTYCTDPKKIANKGDILFSVRAPVGDINIANQQICIGRGLASLSTAEEDNFFLFYLLHFIKEEILISESGTVFGSINRNDLENLDILLPPLTEQRAIASVLSSLDDKIDLLHRENKTLEQMAETLFRQWFVEDADEGWETGILGDFVNITYGKNLSTKKLQNNGYPVFGGNGQIGFFDKYIYEKPQVLISCRGEASGTVNISLPKSFITNNSLILEINKRREITFEYLKYYALNTDFKMYVSGSAQPQITITDLYIAGFTLPDKKTTDCFSDIVRTWESKIINNQRQTRTLEKLRDTLLPKLMSGEVRVKI